MDHTHIPDGGIQYILINLNFVLGGLTSTLDSLMNNFYIKCYILWHTLNKSLMLPTKVNTQILRLTQTLSALLMFSKFEIVIFQKKP